MFGSFKMDYLREEKNPTHYSVKGLQCERAVMFSIFYLNAFYTLNIVVIAWSV